MNGRVRVLGDGPESVFAQREGDPRSPAEVASGAVIVRAEPGSAIAAGLVLELNERCFAARLLDPGQPTPADSPAVLWLLEQRAMLEHLQRACAASSMPNLVLAATRSLGRDALEHIDDRDDVASLAVPIEPTVPLFEFRWVPGAIEMEKVARRMLEVEAFGGGIGGD